MNLPELTREERDELLAWVRSKGDDKTFRDRLKKFREHNWDLIKKHLAFRGVAAIYDPVTNTVYLMYLREAVEPIFQNFAEYPEADYGYTYVIGTLVMPEDL